MVCAHRQSKPPLIHHTAHASPLLLSFALNSHNTILFLLAVEVKRISNPVNCDGKSQDNKPAAALVLAKQSNIK
jgi:hypothetical protein